MSTALVLAAPERKRILRELLSRPEPWTAAQRRLYRNMLHAEWYAESRAALDNTDQDAAEEYIFTELFVSGVSVNEAMKQAQTMAITIAKRKTKGSRERDRRRLRREAVTSFDGARAVTTGVLTACITCQKPLPSWRWRRADVAYCSSACRQKAYRMRNAVKMAV